MQDNRCMWGLQSVLITMNANFTLVITAINISLISTVAATAQPNLISISFSLEWKLNYLQYQYFILPLVLINKPINYPKRRLNWNGIQLWRSTTWIVPSNIINSKKSKFDINVTCNYTFYWNDFETIHLKLVIDYYLL